MSEIKTKTKPLAIAVMLACVAAIVLVAVAFLFVWPMRAEALEVVRWTARENQEGGAGVMGDTPTRVTFQGQAAEAESLEELRLEMPESANFPLEDVKVTVLDELDRLDVESEVGLVGASTIAIVFSEPTPPGTMVMVEVYSIVFPREGGFYHVKGDYTTSDGRVQELSVDTIEPIEVTGLSSTKGFSSWLEQQDWVKAWNSNKFLQLFFNPTIAVSSIPVVFGGWLLALGLVALGFPLAIPVGLFWSFLRMSRNRLVRGIGSLYINVVRGTPLFLQIYIAFFGLPLLGITLDNFSLGVIVLVMNSSAYLAEVFRAGIQSIDKGQTEAARSLGMSFAQTMLSVIIPQTFRRVIPTMTSEFILLYKDTSLLAAVGVMEIMMFSKTITAATGNVTPYIIAAMFYLLVTLPLTKLVNVLEDRMAGLQSGDAKRKVRKKRIVPIEEMAEARIAEVLATTVSTTAPSVPSGAVPTATSTTAGSPKPTQPPKKDTVS